MTDRRIADVAGLSPEDIDEAIRASETAFPFPESEIARLKKRRWVIDMLPKGGVGAEIGVFRGHFSELMCRIVKPETLYIVDPWTLHGAHFSWGTGKYVSGGTLTTEAARDEALLRTARYPETRTLQIEGWFPDCAGEITEPLDWAYVDASHDYEPTLAELHALADLVKPEGAILGDDWSANPDDIHHGVFRAVQHFCATTDWQIVAAGPARQWMIRRGPAPQSAETSRPGFWQRIFGPSR